MKRLLILPALTALLVAALPWPFGCGGTPPPTPPTTTLPPTPTPTPTPEPTPTPTPEPTPPPDPAAQKRLAAACCCSWEEADNPDCNNRDEGIEDGWSAINEPVIEEFAGRLAGTMAGIIVRSSPLPDDHPTFASTAKIQASLAAAKARGLGKSLHDAAGRWPGRHGIDRCGQTAAQVRAGQLNSCWRDWIRARVAATCDPGRVIQSTGNELGLDSLQGLSVPEQDAFRAAVRVGTGSYAPFAFSSYDLIPLRQTDLTAYEREVIGLIREVCPDTEVSSNADTDVPFCSGTSGPICKDFVEIHGFPAEQYWPRAVDLGPNVIWSESANEKRTVSQWIANVEAVENAGGIAGLWRGPHTRPEWATVLEAVAGVAPPPPPPPPPPGSCPTTPSDQWTCRCTDGCDDNRPPEPDLYGAAVRTAIAAVIQAEPRKSYLTEDRRKLTDTSHSGAYTGDVAAELRRMGYCSWANPPWPHKPTKNLDELGVSVGGSEFSHREQWDIVLGANATDVGADTRFLAATCRPK